MLGTDIDRRVVERAQRGWFSTGGHARTCRRAIRDRYFEAAATAATAPATRCAGTCGSAPRISCSDRYAPGWDLVLCRNVVIYFTDAARDHVHRSIAGALRAGRLPHGRRHRARRRSAAIGLEPVHPFIYRKAV